RDGDLDCFVLNHSISKYSTGVADNPEMRNKKIPELASRLYRNDDGKFHDVSDQAGIVSNVLSFGLGIALSDFNNDGWTDIYISNDFKESDYLYLNNKDGTFTESFSHCLDLSSLNSMGSDAADYNNDGLTDIITLDMLAEGNYLQKTHASSNSFDKTNFLISKGFQPQYMRNMLQKNNGDGTFSEIGQLAGISNTDWSWSALFCDFDGDSKKDLFISNGFVKDFSDLDFIVFSADKLLNVNKEDRKKSFNEAIAKMPTIKIPNYIFKNDGNGRFDNKTDEWGLDKPVISAGAAYADLDNDGDMDLVINNNDYASVYENNSRQIEKNNFLRIALEGAEQNRNGIGTRVKVFCDGNIYLQEQFPARGYQSSVDMVLNFGLGKYTSVDSILVIWPNDQFQVLKNIPANQLLKINIKDADQKWNYMVANPKAYFSLAKSIEYHHKENDFNDFTVQSLLLNYASRQGPCMAKADVNKDGREDIFIGGAKGQSGELFLQTKGGEFALSNQGDLLKDSLSEDVACTFFDANADGYDDLYVGSGGYEFSPTDPLLQDRLYMNDGKGKLLKMGNALPAALTSTGCVKPTDIDGDGDLDLFVGGRIIPGNYPISPPSYILLNDGRGIFSDATMQWAPFFKSLGMVTDAVWIDLNHDDKKDLIVVGEWMPVKVYLNNNGKLEDASSKYVKFASSGWWNKILADDFDGDGDLDIVLGNTGTNAQFKASEKEPLSIYYKDFDGNGSVDPIFCYYIKGVSYPSESRNDLIEQLPILRKKFSDYKTYAGATINDIFSPEQLNDASRLSAEMLSTLYLQNDGDSGFTIKKLPQEAQYAPVYAIASADINKDGHKDLVLAGNNAWTRIKFGRFRANHGTVLLGDGKGNFTYTPQPQSGLNARGDIRSMEIIKAKGTDFLVMGVNNENLISYSLQ
ncbi:MAG TPA: VCBS repeat-containing protein, partial [Agriterribacter sp.]|nr:VCBS repeat-containing protein [Agriterribacter sp.]